MYQPTSNLHTRKLISFMAITALTLNLSAANPFPRTDSGPGTAEFRARFLANYGVNSAIEPSITSEDRPLYEKVAPLLGSDPQAAIRIVAAEIDQDSNAAFNFLLGSLYYQTNQTEAAEKQLQQAIEKFPDFRRAHRTLGILYVQDGRHSASINAWLKVITLGGGDAQSYGLLGYSYLAEKKFDSALSAYQMARMFKPDSTDFRRGQAQCLLETGQSLRAIALFEELIEASPETADYWLLQANAFIQLEKYEAAIHNLEVVQALGAGNTASRFLLGNLYLRDENPSLALLHYTQAIKAETNPDFQQALQPLNYLLARHLTDEAEQYWTVLKDKLPENPNRDITEAMSLAKARIESARGNSEAALALLKPVAESNPLNGDALIQIANIAIELEDYAKAELYLKRAQGLPNKTTEALVALGRMEVSRGALQAALTYLRSAQDRTFNSSVARYIQSIEKAL